MKEKICTDVLNEIVEKYSSAREFAAAIGADSSDVSKWRKGLIVVSPRAVCEICRLYPNVKPWQLNPRVFPKDLKFVFGRQ